MWQGDEVIDKITQATKEAIDETTKAAAEEAKGSRLDLPPHSAAGHPWYGVTARVENEVSSEPAKVEGSQVVGRFGATKKRGDYGLMLERLNPYLRPVADREFPGLAKRIADRLE